MFVLLCAQHMGERGAHKPGCASPAQGSPLATAGLSSTGLATTSLRFVSRGRVLLACLRRRTSLAAFCAPRVREGMVGNWREPHKTQIQLETDRH